MPKRKQEAERESSPEAEEAPVKKTKAKGKAKAKEPAITEPYVDDKGWNIHPPSLIYRAFDAEPGKKIAAFDFDGTLVNTKSGGQFARYAADWKLFNKKVPKVIKQYHDEGYTIVIFSNQGGIKSKLAGPMADKVKERVQQVVAKLEVPATVLLATLEDDFRKPSTGMWNFFCSNLNGGIKPDLKSSFFVGDAGGREADPETGRPKDFSDSDKKFAEAVGLPFKSPEDVFGEMEGKWALPTTEVKEGEGGESQNPELVDIFQQLASHYDGLGDKFKSRAYVNVCTALRAFPSKISEANLKEVSKLKGVGKASLNIIKEYLETGKCSTLEEKQGDAAGGSSSGKPSAGGGAKSMAEAFM